MLASAPTAAAARLIDFWTKGAEGPHVLAVRGLLWTRTGRFSDPESRHWKRVFGQCWADENRPLPLVFREKEVVRDVDRIRPRGITEEE